MPEAETGRAVEVLDLLLEYFGEHGERWTRGDYHDGHGRRCLVGALKFLCCKYCVPSESAESFLHQAIKHGLAHRRGGLAYFNDLCRSFAELHSLILQARTLALRDRDRDRVPRRDTAPATGVLQPGFLKRGRCIGFVSGPGETRCRQSVARIWSVLHPSQGARWRRDLTAAR